MRLLIVRRERTFEEKKWGGGRQLQTPQLPLEEWSGVFHEHSMIQVSFPVCPSQIMIEPHWLVYV